MKLVNVAGGLGNQMFDYALCLAFRKQGNKTFVFVSEDYNSHSYGHQGYELEKLFSINKSEHKSYGYKWYIQLLIKVLKKFSSRRRLKIYKILQLEVITEPKSFCFYKKVFNQNKSLNQLYLGTWQSEKYFLNAKKEVRDCFKFNKNLLSKDTKLLAIEMQECNSVFVHIRRGDYLSEKYVTALGNICNLSYYEKSIQYLSKSINNPRFYFFSDDQEWVKENLNIESATYVQFNYGDNSWQDMYLMTQAKHGIIANSTFSWWGAWLIENSKKNIIGPKKWCNGSEDDDIIPNEWIKM
ncbi:alpha-1,2-fucosyltransferase [Polaribacter sp. HaHaR_3_91]|uniref:alpha-1,2-fucosyltransferase n=1 Tax=Polaribacter sp. HaHaR_3_91 TaxID=2745561 RepID=UPI001C4FB74A|nr:alpha-1,2-fucosyltransferase [Polaribacter sp. HaHaR_3_91]QXP64992.1 alpha-1,2-fucosyltransferase [Polaribacter sp. HaHaR_3_91]